MYDNLKNIIKGKFASPYLRQNKNIKMILLMKDRKIIGHFIITNCIINYSYTRVTENSSLQILHFNYIGLYW